MRKVILGAFVSLDGVMQAPGGPEEDRRGGFAYGGWVFPHWDADTQAFIGDLFSQPFDLLLGRRTYEIFSGYWPYMKDPIGDAFNAATKYVATRSDMPLDWDKSVRLKDAAADIARLKREDGRNFLIQGSTVLIQSLQQAGLIDEYHVLTFPLVLGKGKRLFETSVAPGALKLEKSRTSGKGVIMGYYTPNGPVVSGSFAQEEPTEAELARRERWKREG
jgi:dihydrofolate reductase